VRYEAWALRKKRSRQNMCGEQMDALSINLSTKGIVKSAQKVQNGFMWLVSIPELVNLNKWVVI